MSLISTPYLFQYTYFAGKEYSSIVNTKLIFDCDSWFVTKINELVLNTPDLPDEIISRILKNANVC